MCSDIISSYNPVSQIGSSPIKFRIGTRGSPLAIAQARMTAVALSKSENLDINSFPLEIIKTSGDMIQDRALSLAGGKGLFTKEIDEKQLAGEIDLAVHSGKDLPTVLPNGLEITGFLPRADSRDAFIGYNGVKFTDLPKGARIGTASLRRKAQLLKIRPDLKVDLMRGNVQTRILKVETGEYAGTLLAMAGLERLGLLHHATDILDGDDFLPAVAQGSIAIVARINDAEAREAITKINHQYTYLCATAERAFLHELDGSCRTPIAGYATISGDVLTLQVQVLKPDGSEIISRTVSGDKNGAYLIGATLGHEIKALLPDNFFDSQ